MSDVTAGPRSPAQDTVAMTAATMGHDIVAALLEELRTSPGHWPTLSAELQQKTIERLKEKVSGMVRKCLGFILTSNFAAVPGKLEDVSKSKSIKARLTVDTRAMYRHALFDAQGSHVLIVIADPAEWLARMDEIKARGDQLELFSPDANYDPERDQPGYRRDRDPYAPGKSWDELKKSLGAATPETKPADPDTKADQGETPAASGETSGATEETQTPQGESLPAEKERAAELRTLQERLAAVGVEVSQGTLQSRSDADILAASLWLNWYEGNPGAAFLDRPAWLPEPEQDNDE